VEGVWEPVDTAGCKLDIPSNDRAPTSIFRLDPHERREILRGKDCPVGGNKSHLEHIKNKVNTWIDKIKTGYLPSFMGWIAYKLYVWPGVKYGIGKMINDLEKD
jgi:hypothetical protein